MSILNRFISSKGLHPQVVWVCIFLAFLNAHTSFVTAKVLDEYVLKYKVINLTNEFKFTEARNAINEYIRTHEAPALEVVNEIELHYMPKAEITPALEEMLQKAFSLQGTCENRKALELSQECVGRYPQIEYPHIMLSRLYFYDVKDSSAVSEAYEAVHIAPENLHALENLGICCLQTHRKKDAISAFNAIKKIDPKNKLASEFFATLEDTGGNINAFPLLNRSSIKKTLENENSRR